VSEDKVNSDKFLADTVDTYGQTHTDRHKTNRTIISFESFMIGSAKRAGRKYIPSVTTSFISVFTACHMWGVLAFLWVFW